MSWLHAHEGVAIRTNTTAARMDIDAASAGAPIAVIPTALSNAPITYHHLRVSVVSTSGAQANFQVWGT